MGAKITTVAIYVSDRDKLLGWMKAGETLRDKIHKFILKEEENREGGNQDVRKEETAKKN